MICLPDITKPASPVTVWLIPEPIVSLDELESTVVPTLSVQEVQRLRAQRLPKGRFTFLFTRLMVRRVLSAHCPDVAPDQWQFGRSATGKPLLLNASVPLQFNLTHASRLLAIVVGSGDLGIDVEHLRREVNSEELSLRFFLPSEHAQLMSVPDNLRHEQFLRRWTLKEACVKATGLGIARALRQYEILFDEPPCLRFTHLQHGGRLDSWQLWSLQYDDYRLSVTRYLSGEGELPAQILCAQTAPVVMLWRWPADSEPVDLIPDWYTS